MNTNNLLVDYSAMAENLSDRNESSNYSSNNSSTCCSESGQPETLAHIPSFHPCRNPEDEMFPAKSEEMNTIGGEIADCVEVPVGSEKPKDYAIQRSQLQKEGSVKEPTGDLYQGAKDLDDPREAIYTFCREIREIRKKNLHAVLEKTTASGKDIELMKTYGLPLEHMKDFDGFASCIGSIALDRLNRTTPLHAESGSRSLESKELKSLDQIQSGPNAPVQIGASITFERLRQVQSLFQSGVSNNSIEAKGQLPYSHQQQQHHQQQQQQHHRTQPHQYHSVTQITQMQHIGIPQQQHQAKSFSIDAILGLRGGGQSDKHHRLQTYKKHQGQESTTKSLTSSSCSNGTSSANIVSGTNGKLKRVRTIFTAEQLERLEGEFARQQYMVGPERLYLAHALRLTEAQVKVWFQNRRIKWRKLNHEKQSQRLHQSGISTIEHDESHESIVEW